MSEENAAELERKKRAYYLARLRGGEEVSDLVKQITERIYDQYKNHILLDTFVETLEKSGKIGMALYKSFYKFNLYTYSQYERGEIKEMPQSIPLAYIAKIMNNDFAFENFEPETIENKPLEDPFGEESWSVDIPELRQGQSTVFPEGSPDDEPDSLIGIIKEKK